MTNAMTIPRALEPIAWQRQAVALSFGFEPPICSDGGDTRALGSAAPLAGLAWSGRDGGMGAVPGLGHGRTTADTFRAAGVEVRREVFAGEDGRIAVRGLLVNTGAADIRLGDWAICAIQGEAALRLGDVPAGGWRMFRNGRQKNDHPVVVRLGQVDDNYIAAAGQGSETGDLVAGGAPLRLASDPMVVLRAGVGGRGTLLLGFLDQTEHLSQIIVTMDERRAALASLRAVCEFDGCLLPPGGRRRTAWLVLDPDDDPLRAIANYGETVARWHGVAPPPLPRSVYCTWYFYPREELTARDLADELDWFEAQRWPVNTFQVDSGWERRLGDWTPRPEWNPPVEGFVRRIRELGYEPGIWTSPFIADPESELMQRHPEWALRDAAGAPLRFPMMGSDNFVLDVTRPEVLDWLRGLYTRLRGQGFTYHKFDFTRAVAQAKDAVFHDETATRAEAYRRAFAVIRAALGADAYLLVCGGLYLPGIGLADGQRSGSDVRSCWEAPRADTRLRQSLLRFWMNRLWHQDPDDMMVRRRDTPFRTNPISLGRFTDEEARTIAVNQYLGGGLVCFTERMSELDPTRAALYCHCIPSLGVASQPADLFGDERIPAVHVTRVTPRASGLDPWITVAVINWEDHERVLTVPIPPEAGERLLVWEFFEQRFVGLFQRGDSLPVAVPAHGTRLLRIAAWAGRSLALLGTDRHFSMGGVELADWRAGDNTVAARVCSPWPGEFTLWFAAPGRDSGAPQIIARRVRDGDLLNERNDR